MVNVESLPSPIVRHINRLTVGGGKITSITVKRRPITTNNNDENNLSKKGETSQVLHNNSTSTFRKASSSNSRSTPRPGCHCSLCRKGDGSQKRKNECRSGSKVAVEPMVKLSRPTPSPPSCLRSNCAPSRHRRSCPSDSLESSDRRMTYPDTLLSDDLSTDRLFPPSNIHHQQRELGKQATDSRSTSRRSRSSTSRRSSAKRTETTWPRIFNASEMSSATTSGHSDAQLWARGNHSCFDLMDGYPDYKQNYAKKSLKKNRQVDQSDFEGFKDAIIDGYAHRLGDDALFPPARVVSETSQRGGKCLVMSLTELR